LKGKRDPVFVLNVIAARLRAAGSWIFRQIGRRWKVALLLLPVAIIALGLAAYGWWWRVLADRVHDSVTQIQNEQKLLGRNLEWSAFEIGGFPYNVDASLSKTRLLAPDLGSVWDGERVVVRLRPLSLNSVKISLEGQQHFFHVSNGRWIEADARADKALLTARSKDSSQSVSAEFERLTGKGKIDASDFHFILERGTAGVSLSAPDVQSALPRLDVVAHINNLGLQGHVELPLGSSIESLDIDLGLKLPEKLPTVSVDALLAAWRATNTPVEVRQFSFEWGGVSLSAVGEIKMDERDLPEGHLRLTLGNHARILELLETYGVITKETHATAKPVLDVLAFVSGDPKRKISVPLRFMKGEVFLGPARIMTMPIPATPSNPEFVP
jgi:hypothetical protein